MSWVAVADVAEVEQAFPKPLRVFAADRSWAVTLLDGELVAFPDRCPHRRVPLSAGTVVRDGDVERLECAYHGWRFGADGRCAAIPALGENARVPGGMKVATDVQVRAAEGRVWLAPALVEG